MTSHVSASPYAGRPLMYLLAGSRLLREALTCARHLRAVLHPARHAMIVVGGIYLLGSLSSSASGQTTRRARPRPLKSTQKVLRGVNLVTLRLFHARVQRAFAATFHAHGPLFCID